MLLWLYSISNVTGLNFTWLSLRRKILGVKFFFDLPGGIEGELEHLACGLDRIEKLFPPGELVKAGELSKLRAEVFLIEEGSIRLVCQSRLLALWEAGDAWLSNLEGNIEFHSEFAVRMRHLPCSEFLKLISQSPELLSLYLNWNSRILSLFIQLTSEFLPGSLSLDFETEIFSEGETIIEQGSEGKDVYTLVDGRAKAVCDGVELGILEPNEIFGAIAALSETARTANVIAIENCTVMKIDPTQFLQLIQGRPETMLRLAKDLAKKLVNTNQKLMELS